MSTRQIRKNVSPPIVVYHVAGMGDWKDVLDEQLQLLVRSGLTSNIRITYLGKEQEYLEDRLALHNIDYTIVRSDTNTDHCETFAMMEIDRLAKEEKVDKPILYMHTKGVSNPGNVSKRAWRHLMEAWVVARWKVNIVYLSMYDAVGVNWIEGGPQHFSGTFWIANPNWIRKLPKFEDYHRQSGMHRYTCELWIGAFQYCKALSLGCKNEPFWNFNYDYGRLMPRAPLLPPHDSKVLKPDSPFRDIFNYFNCDKASEHSYAPIYDALFPIEERESVQKVLEVGIQYGRSLQSWEHAFPNALIFGLDVNTEIEMLGQRTSVAVCDSTKPRFVWEALKKWELKEGTFDLIVDDGSHKFCNQLATAAILKPYLAPNGIYIVEDIYPFHGAKVLGDTVGGTVVDRRGVKQRFDDALLVLGKPPEFFDKFQEPSEEDIPTLFPGDDV